MIHNDVLRSVRYMLKVNDAKMAEIIGLSGLDVHPLVLATYLKKEDDLHAILKSVNFPVSKPELSALFRKAGHDNYRPCGDQLLRNFLKGLTLRVRG